MDWLSISKAKDIVQVREAVGALDVNERDERGRTPLMLFLTYRMPVESVRLLVEHGADIEAEDKLGDSVLKKAIKFKQMEAIELLLAQGVQLNSAGGDITATAWYYARRDPEVADMLLATEGAVRTRLTSQEQLEVDGLLYEENLAVVCEGVKEIQSAEILHAFVNGYNWDDDLAPMELAAENKACMKVTLHDMYELLDGDTWLAMDEEELDKSYEGVRYKQLALLLKAKLAGAE